MSKRMLFGVAALLVLAGGACRKADQQGEMDAPITLKRGQFVSFGKRPLEVTFVRVLEDSRCPIGAVCARAGDAVVQLEGKSSDSGFDTFQARLPGGIAPTDTTVLWDVWSGYRFRLLKLEPYPRAGVLVDSAAYVATFIVRPS